MPTTKLKNFLYRAALPVKGPRPEANLKVEVSGQPPAALPAYRRLLKKHRVLGSAALLSDGEKQQVLLCPSKKPEKRISPDSMFRVASITKMATALAAMVAVSEGKLDLDREIGPVLSAAPLHLLEGITLRQLLSHTSGLRDPANLEEALVKGVPFPELLPECLPAPAGRSDSHAAPAGHPGPRQTPAGFPVSEAPRPGAAFHYSNFGFGLVGCLLEAVYDRPVSAILAEKVFTPLDMRATLEASSLNPADIVPITRVLPYMPGREITVTPLGRVPLTSSDPLRHYGHTAGAMYTDLFSLEKLLRCLMAGGAPLLPPALVQSMTERAASYGKASPLLHYGLGILIIRDPSISSHRILGHQGFAYGCADGAFWEESTGQLLIFLNGGASEARRKGRLGYCNEEMLRWAFRKEIPAWHGSV